REDSDTILPDNMGESSYLSIVGEPEFSATEVAENDPNFISPTVVGDFAMRDVFAAPHKDDRKTIKFSRRLLQVHPTIQAPRHAFSRVEALLFFGFSPA
ncbi:MAG: hypothetical protein ACI4XA_05075, partial [Oscillospiraceae bacterium]